jgi:putative hydrolase of the HAD superfamily
MINVKVVFFDAAGTLIEPRSSVGEIYAEAAREFGFNAVPQTLQQNFVSRFREQPPMAFPVGTPPATLSSLEKDWWRNLVRDVFDGLGPFPRFDEFFDDVFDRFRKRDLWRVYEDVRPTLSALKDRGLRLGVVSNFDSRLYDILWDCDLGRFFNSVHISTQVGAAKPDPAIFQAALGFHSAEAGQGAHVGDSPREDFEGAAAVGLNAVLLDRGSRFAGDARATRITTLDQIVSLIEP